MAHPANPLIPLAPVGGIRVFGGRGDSAAFCNDLSRITIILIYREL
jgi:hypothetical protein